MDPLVRIKRLVVARRVEFTLKAEEERLRDGLAVEDVLESIVNANAIKKTLRSRGHPVSGERLYVIESPTYRRIVGSGSTPKVFSGGKVASKSSMSSSRRSSRDDAAAGRGRCPTCGSRRVSRVTEDVTLTIRGRRRFAHVEHERCAACGERIFGIEASLRFDAALRKGRGSHAA